jgi:hypothetical protein
MVYPFALLSELEWKLPVERNIQPGAFESVAHDAVVSSHVRETARSATISWSTRWDLLTGISATKIAGSPLISDVG